MNINNLARKFWLVFAVVVAVLIPIYGAWHHLFTVAVSVLMYLMMAPEKPAEESKAEDTPE